MYSFLCLEPVYCSMSSSNCCFLTCIDVPQEAGKVVWYSHLFQNFPQFVVIHTVKGFGIINKAEVDVFLEFSCFLDDLMDVGNLIFASSAFSKSSLNIWKFTVHSLLKPGLGNFEHYFASMCLARIKDGEVGQCNRLEAKSPQFSPSSVSTAFATYICSFSHQNSISLPLIYEPTLWFTLSSGIQQKWQCTRTKHRPFKAFDLLFPLLEPCSTAR